MVTPRHHNAPRSEDRVGSQNRQIRTAAPLRRLASLDGYAGMWVAVADGEVVAAAKTSHQLALNLHNMDHRRRARTVIEYVRPAAESYIVGVG